MKKHILTFLCGLSLHSICFAGYDIDLIIGDTNNTKPLTTSIKFSEIPEKIENNLPEKILDEDGFITYQRPSLGQIISPSQHLKIKIKASEESIVNLQEYASFSGKSLEDRAKDSKWHSLVFEVFNKQEKWETILLYWAYAEKSIFVTGESENFVFSSFQRSLPKFDKKSKDYKQTLEISLIEK